MTAALRLQLFGIALILVGGLNSVVEAVQGYSVGGAIVVMAGLLVVLLGLVGPLFRRNERTEPASDSSGR
ncbi:hypothetical protein [Haloglomus litoreum]|uniref:hypothetical protein n=1 Tax=Haloglomus litoreum TaxID=3034026 RepID=UPI0023E839FC|nr:hypothetical protein [Haloglomus sp. DT116]